MFYSEHTLRITAMYVMWRIFEVKICVNLYMSVMTVVRSDGMATSCGWSKAVMCFWSISKFIQRYNYLQQCARCICIHNNS